MKILSSSIVLLFLINFFLMSYSIESHGLKNYHHLPRYGLKNGHQKHQLYLKNVIGPESLVFDCNGKGRASDGRILKWQGSQFGWTEFAITAPNRPRELCDGSTNTTIEALCGRPLGLRFHPITCDLYITDAYFGLMVIGPKGGLAQQLVSSAEGIPFRYTNALDIDPNTGLIYFTDSSLFFQRSQFLLPILEGDKSGRLLKYDLNKKQVTVMYRGLAYPNGVALSKDYSFLLIVESTPYRIFRFWLHDQGETRNYYAPQLFAQLKRYPDNIERTKNGDFWVALNTARENEGGNDLVGVKYNEMGNIVSFLYGNSKNALVSVSDIVEHDGKLFAGSSVQPYVGVIKV